MAYCAAGGDVDAASKTLIGLHFPEQQAEEDARFLVAVREGSRVEGEGIREGASK